MTNSTIYRKAQELPFVQFCKWYDRAVRKRKNRDSSNASNEPFSVVECSEVGRRTELVRRLSQVEQTQKGALPIYEDND